MGFRTYLWDRRRSWLRPWDFWRCFSWCCCCSACPFWQWAMGRFVRRHLSGGGHLGLCPVEPPPPPAAKPGQEVLSTLDNLPLPGSSLEEDYQRLLVSLFRAKAAQSAESSSRFQNMTDYYTLWAHQIKTPIAAMDLILQTQELPESGSLKQSLFQIQQYVEMVLCYLRLDSETTDFVIRACPWTPSSAPPCGVCPSFIHKACS